MVVFPAPATPNTSSPPRPDVARAMAALVWPTVNGAPPRLASLAQIACSTDRYPTAGAVVRAAPVSMTSAMAASTATTHAGA